MYTPQLHFLSKISCFPIPLFSLLFNQGPTPLVVCFEHACRHIRLAVDDSLGPNFGKSKIELGAIVNTLSLLDIREVGHGNGELGDLFDGLVGSIAWDGVLRTVVGV